MPDAALDNAHARRGSLAAQINVLQQQLEGLRRELQLVDEFIARWHTFASLEDGAPLIPADNTVDNSPEREKKARPSNPPRSQVGDVVEGLLREWGRPATRARLFEELPAHGIYIEGTDPAMVFSTMMWRMRDRFERVPGRGYWLKGVPIPGEAPSTLPDLL